MSLCKCNDGFKGEMCNLRACPISSVTLLECSGHGICNSSNGVCDCNSGFTGGNCEAPFALLPRRNRSWKYGILYGGNETIDSFARKIDALESAQLLNNTAVEEAHADHLKMQRINFSSSVNESNYSVSLSIINKTDLAADYVNDRTVNTFGSIDESDVEPASAIMKSLKLENEFTNADYGPKRLAWKKYLHKHNSDGMKNNKLAYTKWSENYDDNHNFRFKEKNKGFDHASLVAAAISELSDDKKRHEYSEKPETKKKLLRSQ
jgi:hypothetical protein